MSRLWRAFSLWPLTFSFPFLPLSFSTDSLPAAIGLLFMLFIHSLFSTLMSVSEPQISLDKSKSMEQNVQTVSIGTHTHTHTPHQTLFVWMLTDVILGDDRSGKLKKEPGNVQKQNFMDLSSMTDKQPQCRLKHCKVNSTPGGNTRKLS